MEHYAIGKTDIGKTERSGVLSDEPGGVLGHKFRFDTQLLQITMSEGLGLDLRNPPGDQDCLIATRQGSARQAAATIRIRTGPLIVDCAASRREQAARQCGDPSASPASSSK